MNRKDAIIMLRDKPVIMGHAVGFTKLDDMHNKWIVEMVRGTEDDTLQAHRGSYKTTCVSIALAIMITLFPNMKLMFMRKTDNDTKEIITQVKKILLSPQWQCIVEMIYNHPIELTSSNMSSISTNLTTDIRGTAQLTSFGTRASITGKHFDRIFTDDIVNLEDRKSRAERERIKLVYMELQNVKNRGGRIFNTGTPWHVEDCFKIMPTARKFSCYDTGLIGPEELQSIKDKMEPSLFAANYELIHIAGGDIIFHEPHKGADPALAEQGTAHIDAAYNGEDYTAFTIMKKTTDGKYYVFGKLWRKHVDDVMGDIIKYRTAFMAGRILCEDNGDKGYLARDLRKLGERVSSYHESMNKFIKITTYLKAIWNDVYFVEGTDDEYISQICDYNENAEHDDAPDSLSSLARIGWKKNDTGEYISPITGRKL